MGVAAVDKNASMGSVERVFAALRREQPDRVPISESIIDENVARVIMPDMLDIQDFMDRVGLDTVGCRPQFAKVKDNGDGTYIDEWGVLYQQGGSEELAHPVRGPIETMSDAMSYIAPNPDLPHRLGNLKDVVSRYKGKRAIVFWHRCAFMWSAYLMGMDNLLAALIMEPDLACAVMDKVLEANMRVAQNAIRAGADIIVMADDYAYNSGPMMSPQLCEKYLIPRLADMVSLIHKEGAFCVKHTDGDLYSILDMIVGTGIDGINPIEPAAGMELSKIKRLVGDKVCIVGNIDCSHLLPHGTPEQVEEAVIQAINDAGEGGGLIISSSNSIHSSVNPANFLAMINAVHKYGHAL